MATHTHGCGVVRLFTRLIVTTTGTAVPIAITAVTGLRPVQHYPGRLTLQIDALTRHCDTWHRLRPARAKRCLRLQRLKAMAER